MSHRSPLFAILQYDPPFQWRWLRTNEVLLEVKGEGEAQGEPAEAATAAKATS
jgi:hypothetical protein